MIIETVFRYAKEIKNNRSLKSVLKHMKREVKELDTEIHYVENNIQEGEDGVIGEAVDVIACAIDVIYLHKPDITPDEINNIMIKKCKKWKEKYQHVVYKE